MPELLHTLAVAPAAFAACCMTASGTHRRGEIAASVLMTAAMLDAAVLHLVSALWWALTLGAAALTLSVRSRVQTGTRRGSSPDEVRSTIHTGLGLVTMAALLAVMAGPPSPTAAGHHGMGPLAPLVATIVIAHAAVSLAWALGARGMQRARHLAMGLAALLMAAAALA